MCNKLIDNNQNDTRNQKTINKVLVIGSGPIIIGAGAEFDYAGTQACKALKEEGVEVVLVNSNPATIMTDERMADHVYIQPITLEALTEIIEKEKPDGLLATLGGQTALNMAMELKEEGILEKYNLKLLGTDLTAIKKAEDRQSFKQLMLAIEEPVIKSEIVSSEEDGLRFIKEIGYPVILRPAYTMGGLGGGIASNEAEFIEILHLGLLYSPINQVLIEQSIAGWKEVEYEVMRDGNDTCIIVCNMENMDPVGIHTGDSIVVAPSQTLTDRQYQMLRTSATKIVRALDIKGGCNVQYALHPTTDEYGVIEVNPRVSRSSALASKATGYPIAKISAKIALGQCLHEIINPVTQKTMAAFEPTLDYVVVKIPKLPFDKFHYADRTLGTQMQATGEVMAIDRSFESAFLKAVISLEGKVTGLRQPSLETLTKKELIEQLKVGTDQRYFVIAQALRKGLTIEEIAQVTKIHSWFIEKLNNIINMEQSLTNEDFSSELLTKAEAYGFTDVEIESLSGKSKGEIDTLRRVHDVYPVYKMVDTCGAEFSSNTPYFYSCYDKEDESVEINGKEKVIVIGSGPIRIGQGIEFDYASVHAALAIQEAGFQAIMVNNNPETVSTDFDISDKLYFEPLYIEDVLNIVRKEMPKGVILQFGGQTGINLAEGLRANGVQVLGTTVEAMHIAEDRERFDNLLQALEIHKPEGHIVYRADEGIQIANRLGYPVLVRPSFVIGGRGMQVVHCDEELMDYLQEATALSDGQPILVDKYIRGQEIEIDAICDGENFLIPGIMEHIEKTGVHSGDSFSVYPPQKMSSEVESQILSITGKVSKALKIKGLVNIQFVEQGGKVFVIEVNPRASRTIPIMSKVTGVPMVKLAIEIMVGKKLSELGYGIGLYQTKPLVAVKAPIFSFHKLKGVDVALTPEMKSTGEVLGIDRSYSKALLKAFLGAGYPIHQKGTILMSVASNRYDEVLILAKKLEKIGYKLVGTRGTSKYLASKGIKIENIQTNKDLSTDEMMRKNMIQGVLNLPTKGRVADRDGFKLREKAEALSIPCFTCIDTFEAYMMAVKEARGRSGLEYESMRSYLQ